MMKTMPVTGQTAVKGKGTVAKAEIKVDGVVFDKEPGSYTVGINLAVRPIVAFGVATAKNQLYSNTGTAWTDKGVILSAGYQAQVLGAYATNDTNGFIVLTEGSSLKQIDMNDPGFAVQPLAPLPNIPAGYAICGFNYTRGKLNMYLTR